MNVRNGVGASVGAWVFLALLVGCSGGNSGMPDAADVVSRDMMVADVGFDVASDAPPCSRNLDCDDGVFCNGVERCLPSDPQADRRGCTPPSAPPCTATQRCDEAMAQCLPGADSGTDADAAECDHDRDGQNSIACGGADCDDDDAFRYRGNPERCDGQLPDGRPAASHDEDCDPCTVAGLAPDGDSDSDTFPSSACRNDWLATMPPLGCDPNRTRVRDETYTAAPRTVTGADCDDSPTTGVNVRPNQVEQCMNGVDDNCDGAIDEAVTGTVYRDADNDRRGNALLSMSANLCAVPTGYVANDEDCDDTRPETYLGAREMCDGLDNDCSLSGSMGGGPEPTEDADGDHYSPIGAGCLGAGEGGALATAFPRTDCNDASATVHPMAPEICPNGIDEDCNGTNDDPLTIGCVDADGDGRSISGTMRTFMQCGYPAGYAACPTAGMASDCNDGDATVYPGATEFCDRIDSDCSTGGGVAIDEDQDADGFASSTASCIGLGGAGAPPSALPRTDCDDSSVMVFPGAAEVCNATDDNCNGTTDEGDPGGGAACGTGLSGMCGAGVQHCVAGMSRCVPPALPDTVPELCNGVDDDCDGAIDEGIEGAACALAGGTGLCTRGLCRVRTCTAGRADCNADPADGCEVDLMTSAQHCGVCGSSCGIGGSCSMGRCDAGFIDVESGPRHVCAVRANGNVACWGDNSSGQLGDGTTSNRTIPTVVTGVTDAVQVSTGREGSCARLRSGSVRCWGRMPGDGTFTSSVPTTVSGLTDAVEVSTGGTGSCARRADNTVVCWGPNTGSGMSITSASPTPVQVTGLNDATQISVGYYHTCARRMTGQIVCWGVNVSGQLGDGTTTDRATPVLVPGITDAVEVRAGVANDTMREFTCARRVGGAIVCWGDNFYRQVENSTATNRVSPVPITMPAGTGIPVELVTGPTRGCVRTDNGSIVCWGHNFNYSFGVPTMASGSLPPTAMPNPPNVVSLAAGFFTACARRASGTVLCWGGHSDGALGDPDAAQARAEPRPALGTAPTATITSSIDDGHTCARQSDGRTYCWGRNDAGQLGLGDMVDRNTPTALALMDITHLGLGSGHSCARRLDGSVWCWGYGGFGALGDGTRTTQTTPVRVAGITNASSVVTGSQCSCALLADGHVTCWGFSTHGATGNVSINATPVTVTGIDDAVAIAGGGDTLCAIRATGDVSCWGQGTSGQIGDGMMIDRSVPTAVPALRDAIGIDTGWAFTCARTTTYPRGSGRSRAWCWGSNGHGQLGDGTTTTRATPVEVAPSAMIDWAEVRTGYETACGRTAAGVVQCWGRSESLGDGSTMDRPTPGPVRLASGIDLVGTQIDCGYHTLYARRTLGDLTSNGVSLFGDLGQGPSPMTQRPGTIVLIP